MSHTLIEQLSPQERFGAEPTEAELEQAWTFAAIFAAAYRVAESAGPGLEPRRRAWERTAAAVGLPGDVSKWTPGQRAAAGIVLAEREGRLEDTATS